ncbi:trigger factor [soil metagenome]
MDKTPQTPAPGADDTSQAPSPGADAPQASSPAGFRYAVARAAGSMVTLTVDVEAERVAAATDRAFQRLVRQAKIPGFRPGKAPRAIYERTYGTEHLWHEAAEDVSDETYREVVQREELQPLDQPEVTIASVEPGQPLSYTATLPVRPEVSLGAYIPAAGLVEPRTVTEEEVEQTIAGMREHHAELRAVPRNAEQHDILTIDLDATLGDRTVPLGRGAHLELGREYAIPGLADGLAGAVAGEERVLDLRFPDDHPDEDVRGKSARFTVRVSEVSEKILPDLDDGFAKTVGVESLAALRKAVRSELAHASFHEARDRAADQLMEQLLAASTVEVPEVLLRDELDHMVAALKERVSEQGLTFEQFLLQARKTEDEIRSEWRAAAERRAKALLVLDAAARKEGVTISGTELAQEVALTPLAQADPKALRDPAVLASLARSLRNRKVVDKLIGLDSPDAERDAIRKAGGPVDDEGAGKLIVPDPVPQGTAEGREAIRGLLRD